MGPLPNLQGYYMDEHVEKAVKGLMLIYQVIEAEEMVNHCEFL